MAGFSVVDYAKKKKQDGTTTDKFSVVDAARKRTQTSTTVDSAQRARDDAMERLLSQSRARYEGTAQKQTQARSAADDAYRTAMQGLVPDGSKPVNARYEGIGDYPETVQELYDKLKGKTSAYTWVERQQAKAASKALEEYVKQYGKDADAAEIQRALQRISRETPLRYVGETALTGLYEGVAGIADYVGDLLQGGAAADLQRAAVTTGMLGNVTGDETLKQSGEDLLDKSREMQSAEFQRLRDYGVMGEATRFVEDKQEQLQQESQRQSGATKVAADVTGAIAGMVPNVVARLIDPAASMGVLFMSAAGSATTSAMREGASTTEALQYGTLVGMGEVITEMMFDGLSGLVGGGAADDLVKNTVRKLIKNNPQAQTAMIYSLNVLGEGFEEFVAEWIGYASDRLTIKQDDREAMEILGDAGYSMLVGTLMSSIMNAGSIPKTMREMRSEDFAAMLGMSVDEAMERIKAAASAVERGATTAEEAAREIWSEALNADGRPASAADDALAQLMGAQNGAGTISPENVSVEGRGAQNGAQLLANSSNEAQIRADAEMLRQGYRAAALNAAKASLGESGYAAYEQAYRDTAEPEVENRALTRAYNDGLAGVKGKAEGIAQEQYDAMYNAGVADAAASVSVQEQQKTAARAYGKDSGIDYSDAATKAYVGSVNKGEIRVLDEVAKLLGVKVRFADKVSGGQANAEIKNGVVTIEKGNRNPVRWLFGHEITHRLQEMSPEVYARLRTAVASESAVTEYIPEIMAAYTRAGRSITNEEALDEAIANYVGSMLEDTGALERFIRRHRGDRTLLEKLRDIFRDLKNLLTGKYQAAATEAERLLDEALEGGAAQARANENAPAADGESAGKTSLKMFEDGTRFVDVQIDQKRFDGRTAEEKTKLAVSIIRSKFAGKVVGIDNRVFVNARGAREYGRPVRNIVGETRGVKMRAAAELDNLIDAGFNFRTRPDGADGHTHPTATGDFEYFDVIFKVGKDYYKGIINIMNVARGRLFKDITKIENITQDISSSYGTSPKSTFLRDTSMETISQEEDIVKAKIRADENKPVSGEEKTSLKGTEAFADEIYQIARKGAKAGKSQDEIRSEVRAAVDAQMDALREEYGTIPAGEKPYREANVPKRTEKNKKVSQTVRTILEAESTPDALISEIEQMVSTGEFSYEAYGDKQALADAETKVRREGWNTSYAKWMADSKRGIVSKEQTALGWVLYNNAANSGDVKAALDILNSIVGNQRSAAQALQATRILKNMSPEGQLYGIRRSVESLSNELKEKYGEKAPDLKIDEGLAEAFLAAESDEARAEAAKALYQDIGRQMPSRFVDKWNAWRYLAMLGNARTHIRNIFGNAFFVPVIAAKNLTAAGIERIVNAASGGKVGRTKSVAIASKRGRELIRAAAQDYTKVSEALPAGRYSETNAMNKYVEEGRVIFGNVEQKNTKVGKFMARTLGKVVEKARKGNSFLLSAEDAWFSQRHYAAALAQYCLANNISPQTLQSGTVEQLAKAREYAMEEALKATYQDINAFSAFFQRLGSTQSKAANALVGGVLPFRRTPANILARGIEYSPLGLAKGLWQTFWGIRNGKATAAQAIDSIASGLTGSALMAVGFMLSQLDMIRGGGDEDKEKERDFAELLGHQNYALELPGGMSVTLDWLAPEALPFFIGVNLAEAISDSGDELKMEDIVTAIGSISDPLLEMSCLQSLNELIDTVGYASSNGMGAVPSILVSAATSLVTQAVPTIFGQLERTVEGDERMTTYTDKNKWLGGDTQYLLGRISTKIPGWDYGQIPYIDAWGRTESTGGFGERAFNNFLNPAYMSEVDVSKAEKELQRLYDATGETSVLPSRASRYFTVNGERVDLTGEQYVRYAQNRGRTAYKLVSELVSNPAYKALSDDDKRKAVEKCYDVANEKAKELVSDYKVGDFHKDMEGAADVGISNAEYIVFYIAKSGMHTIKNAKGKVVENVAGRLREWLRNSGFTRKQKAYLWSTVYSTNY